MAIDISIIVPSCDRNERLKDCLESLLIQNYPREKTEIIIVDDRLNTHTEEILKPLQKDHGQLRYLAQDSKGPATARNLGIRESQGEIIAFVDDDCVVESGWIKAMVKTHRDNPKAAAVGGMTQAAGQKIPALVSQHLANCSIEALVFNEKKVVFFPTCNVSFKRWIFDENRFDEQFPFAGGEDLEFFWRLFKKGFRFIWNKDIKVFHHRDNNALSFIKQAYVYGRGNFLTQAIHKDHPLLKELKTGRIVFWPATLINIIKIPRFSYMLGRQLIRENNIGSFHGKVSVFFYFVLHKIFYIFGNIAEYLELSFKTGKEQPKGLALPQLLVLDITHACNLSCRICEIWKTKKSEDDLRVDYIKQALVAAKELGISEIALSGGEPLLRKDIFEIIEYARKIKIKKLGILTNGILVGEYIEKLKPYLYDNTISLVFSLDSLNPNVFNDLRNSSFAWQKALESLKIVSALKEQYSQISFSVITIVLNQNLGELSYVARFVKSLGADSLQFQAVLSNNLNMAERKKSFFWVPDERLSVLDEEIEELIEFKTKNADFIRNSFQNLKHIKKYFRGRLSAADVKCVSADKTILISNQGRSTTCFSDYGDIKTQSLNEIVQSQKAQAARRKAERCVNPCLLPCFCDMEGS